MKHSRGESILATKRQTPFLNNELVSMELSNKAQRVFLRGMIFGLDILDGKVPAKRRIVE